VILLNIKYSLNDQNPNIDKNIKSMDDFLLEKLLKYHQEHAIENTESIKDNIKICNKKLKQIYYKDYTKPIKKMDPLRSIIFNENLIETRKYLTIQWIKYEELIVKTKIQSGGAQNTTLEEQQFAYNYLQKASQLQYLMNLSNDNPSILAIQQRACFVDPKLELLMLEGKKIELQDITSIWFIHERKNNYQLFNRANIFNEILEIIKTYQLDLKLIQDQKILIYIQILVSSFNNSDDYQKLFALIESSMMLKENQSLLKEAIYETQITSGKSKNKKKEESEICQ